VAAAGAISRLISLLGDLIWLAQQLARQSIIVMRVDQFPVSVQSLAHYSLVTAGSIVRVARLDQLVCHTRMLRACYC